MFSKPLSPAQQGVVQERLQQPNAVDCSLDLPAMQTAEHLTQAEADSRSNKEARHLSQPPLDSVAEGWQSSFEDPRMTRDGLNNAGQASSVPLLQAEGEQHLGDAKPKAQSPLLEASAPGRQGLPFHYSLIA